MKILSFFLSLFLISTLAIAGNGSGNVSNVYGFGANQAGTSAGPSIASSDLTKFYTASCNLEESVTTTGDYYKCAKQGGTSTGDWSVAAGKTAYCLGFFAHTNSLSSVGATWFTFGYGTTATTQGASSAPAGSVIFGAQASNPVATYITSLSAYGQNQWVSMPIQFPAGGSAIYPYIYSGAGGNTLGVNLICTDQ